MLESSHSAASIRQGKHEKLLEQKSSKHRSIRESYSYTKTADTDICNHARHDLTANLFSSWEHIPMNTYVSVSWPKAGRHAPKPPFVWTLGASVRWLAFRDWSFQDCFCQISLEPSPIYVLQLSLLPRWHHHLDKVVPLGNKQEFFFVHVFYNVIIYVRK